MPRSNEIGRARLRSFVVGLAAIVLLAVVMPVPPAVAQASGHLRVKFAKAGLLVGGGAGSGVLTYRGRDFPFSVSGISFGITAGATVSRLDGWASGIRDVSDFAGRYSSVGGGAALVGGINGVHLRNDKGVVIVLQGPKAGLEFAANLSEITISLK
jgi:hypothetical protein